MSDHRASVGWTRTGPEFIRGRYSREHTWTFDGGLVVAASASPAVVPVPLSNPANVDPEEAFVAAVSSCHMLTYLFLASTSGFIVDTYEDRAVGTMTTNELGIPWMSEITLTPRITYGGDRLPTPNDERRLHHRAHEQCYISNSIKTAVSVKFLDEDASPPTKASL